MCPPTSVLILRARLQTRLRTPTAPRPPQLWTACNRVPFSTLPRPLRNATGHVPPAAACPEQAALLHAPHASAAAQRRQQPAQATSASAADRSAHRGTAQHMAHLAGWIHLLADTQSNI